MKAKGGNKYAIVATANKLATIFYRMVKEQVEFSLWISMIIRNSAKRLKSHTWSRSWSR
jgi:hypothetical protein